MKRKGRFVGIPVAGVFCLSAIVFCLTLTGNAYAQPELKQAWATDKVMQVPESVLYNPGDNLLYISNISGKPLEKNGGGFISKITPSGEIKTLKWATGLNAPKGAAIFKDRFYVSDIDVLAEIDMKTGKVTERYPAEGSGFLNDVAVDRQGHVYVSDYDPKTSAIYRLANGRLDVWLKSPEIARPNGLHMRGDQLLVGNSKDGVIKSVNIRTKEMKTVVTIGWGIDGLRPDGRGNYFISDWSGRTGFVSGNGAVTVLLNTTEAGINSADLEYVPSLGMLFIPTFFDNRVVAYKVVWPKEK